MKAVVETATFGGSSEQVTAIDAWVERVAARWGKSERTVFRTRLCIAELAANVLEHGVARADDAHIVIVLHQLGDGIGVEFLDSGTPFDPTRQSATRDAGAAESARPGGWGLMLVRAYAKELAYSNDGTRNHVSLKISSADAAEGELANSKW